MAAIFEQKNRDGTTSFVAKIRLKNFSPVSKSFQTDKDLPKPTARAAAKKEAVAWAEAYEKRLKDQVKEKRNRVRANISTLTVGDLINLHLKDPETKALRAYENHHDLLDWWVIGYKNEKVLDFGVVTLQEARDRLLNTGRRGRKRANGTVNRHLSAMRAAWNWGIAVGVVPRNEAWPTKLMLTEPPGRIRFLSSQELAAVLKAADPDPVMRAAILVSIATGIRQGELLRLKWKDIDLDGGKLTVMESKNATPRSVHLTATAVEALRVLKEAKVVSPGAVFLVRAKPLKKATLIDRWQKIRTAARLVDFHWHDLRHTCASLLAQNGASLLEIGTVLGHKSPSMTQRYAHLVQGAPVKGHAELDAALRGKP